MTSLRFLTFTFCNYDFLKLLRLVTVTFSDATLKEQCHEIFCFRFLSLITFPRASENNTRVISNFFKNSQRYSQVKVHHRCQQHRWQICHRCQLQRWQIAAGINNTGSKFATVINDTSGKFCHQFCLCC